MKHLRRAVIFGGFALLVLFAAVFTVYTWITLAVGLTEGRWLLAASGVVGFPLGAALAYLFGCALSEAYDRS